MSIQKKRYLSLITVFLLILSLFTGCVTLENEPPLSDDIVILFTNDTHCGMEENIGYAGLAAYKKSVEAQTPYVTLVDCGDAVQGDVIGTLSNGSYLVDIMNELDYDFAVPGNHEFDYGMEQLKVLVERSEAQYLGCNLTYTGSGENALADMKPYEIVEYGETSVAFIGVLTPETITKSTPTFFMENGEYVYSFGSGEDGRVLYRCVQGYVDECRAAGADYVVVLSHLGDAEESAPYTSVDLIKETVGIDVILDGHAHSTISCRVEENKNGEDVLLSSTGTKLDNIGQLVITENGHISTGLISDYRQTDAATQGFIDGIKANYQAEVERVLATSDTTLTGYTADGIRLVRNRETTIGNLCADAYRAVGGADIGMVNGGGIRADLAAGDITYADLLSVHPYGNTLCVVKATGQEILDCLEVASVAAKSVAYENGNAVGEDGSFQHVSGLKYTIDTSVEPSVVLDENGMFVSVSGARRVKDVYVMNAEGEYVPIDPDATYTVASHNYMLKECGGGMNMFADNEFISNELMPDYQVLTTYLTQYLNGELGSRYSATEGRITVE